MTDCKQRIRALLDIINFEPSRHRPFLTRSYPYRGRRKMLNALGDTLNTETPVAGVRHTRGR